MASFEQDRAECLERFLKREPVIGPEGLRDSLYQAYLWLSAGGPARSGTAHRLLREAPWGPCPYSGIPAVQILMEFGPGLPEDVRELLLDFLRLNRDGWREELERGACNSFRLMAAGGLLGCGLLLGDAGAARAGGDALTWMEERMAGCDLPEEFLSPFYTGLQLSALAEIQALPVPCAERARRLEEMIWSGVLRHFQPGLAELAGPYSRGYTSELAGHFQFICACILRLLGEEAGFTLGGTLWDPAYSSRVLPHGTVENMRCYALYFSSFAYHCREEDLRLWRSRTYPFRTEERTRTSDAWDVSIKKAVPAGLPCDYPGGELHICSVQEKGFSLGWSDREFENGMACASPHILYQKDGYAKSCFLKLVRSEDRFIGETLDYPNLGLRMGASNFPDDGRKTAVREGDALRVSYRPRSFLRGAAAMKLDVIFSTHFSPPDAVSIGGRRVEDRDGGERFPLETAAVRDGEWEFSFQPVDGRGFWRVVERNHILELEWVRETADFDTAEWTLLLRCRRV